MKTFGIVLVVFLFILSAVFAGAQMVLFSRRQNYHKQLKDLQRDKEAEVARLNKEISDRDAEIKRGKDALIIAEEKRRTLDTQVSNLTAEVKALETDKATLGARIKELTDTADKNSKIIADANRQIEALDNARRDLEEKNRTQSEEIAKLKEEGHNKDVEIAGLKKTIGDLERLKTDLSEQLAEAKAKIERAIRQGYSFDEAHVPPIDARVLKVDPELKVVVLSVGEQDGVKPNHKFVIYRGAKFVARVEVSYVAGRTAVAQPVLISEGESIQVGDAATTRIN